MDLKKLPKTEFAASLIQLAGEKGISAETILTLLEAALISAYKKEQKENGNIIADEVEFTAEISAETGSFQIFELTDKGKKDVTPPTIGRIAVQAATQVINQGINQTIREKLIEEYRGRVGTLVQGVIVRSDPYKMSVDLGKIEAICPKDEQIRNESFTLGSKKMFLLKAIEESETGKLELILSRRDPQYVIQLFAREVPEVGNNIVSVERIARSAGERTKVAVASNQPGVDPVGSCIGQKGSRVQAVLNELPAEEKVDVIAFNKNLDLFIVSALSPATGGKVVNLDTRNKTATVTVPDDQLALAIGSGGDNVRLAGQLVGDFDLKVISASRVVSSKEEAI